MMLKTKLSLLTSLLIVCIIAGFSAFLFLSEKKFLYHQSTMQREQMITSFAEVAKEYFISKEEIPLFSYIKQLKTVPEIRYALVTDINGKIFAHTDIDLLWSLVKDVSPNHAPHTHSMVSKEYRDEFKNNILDISYPVVVNQTTSGYVRIGFLKDRIKQSIHHMLAATRNRIVIIGLIALIMGVIAAHILARRITQPIQKLAESAVQVGRGNLDTHIIIDSHDEIGTLAQRFNEMTEQLKELDQLKQDFVSGVTHELRSPLTSLSMYIGLFYEGAAGLLNAKSKEFLDIMGKNVDRLKRFIDNLLDVAKLERGKMEIRKTTVDTAYVVQEINNLFKPQSEQYHIRFNIDMPKQAPCILADADKTIQILTNLISNAFKFTRSNGSITLAISTNNHSVLFSVSDTGIGIASAHIKKLFNKFEQVHTSSDQNEGTHKGTGLGLAIVKNLVDLQGGKVWVESKPNKGSTFFFTLPRVD